MSTKYYKDPKSP